MSDEFTKRQALLAEKLYDLTTKKKINWAISEYSSSIEAPFDNFVVKLRKVEDNDGSLWEVVEIKDQFETRIDSFSDGTIKDETFTFVDGFSSLYEMMLSTREKAERQARKVDVAIDSIFAAIDKLDS